MNEVNDSGCIPGGLLNALNTLLHGELLVKYAFARLHFHQVQAFAEGAGYKNHPGGAIAGLLGQKFTTQGNQPGALPVKTGGQLKRDLFRSRVGVEGNRTCEERLGGRNGDIKGF